jgi:hypothetical protein
MPECGAPRIMRLPDELKLDPSEPHWWTVCPYHPGLLVQGETRTGCYEAYLEQHPNLPADAALLLHLAFLDFGDALKAAPPWFRRLNKDNA